MKIYSNSRSQDTESIIRKFLGKDIWIRIKDLDYGGPDNEFYMQPLNISSNGELHQHYFAARMVDNLTTYDPNTIDEFQLEIYARDLQRDITQHYTLEQSIKYIEIIHPLDAYTTQDLQDMCDEVLL